MKYLALLWAALCVVPSSFTICNAQSPPVGSKATPVDTGAGPVVPDVGASAGAAIVDPDVPLALDRLRAEGRVEQLGRGFDHVRVVVRVESLPTDPTFTTPGLADPVASVATAVAARQAEFVAELARRIGGEAPNAVVLDRLALQCDVVLALRSHAALAIVVGIPGVRHVWLDRLNAPYTVEGRARTRSDRVASLGHTGAGVGIAVIDDHFDLLHAELGGSLSLPNGVVFDGANFSNPGQSIYSSILAACYHGTATASIARRYATDADLYCLTVFPNAFDSVIANAINWCVQHRDGSNGGAPIQVISLSLGSGRYFAAQTSGVVHTACGNALSNGILCCAAAGNDGWTDSMGSPAASTHAISIGSVWDADAAPYTPFPPAYCAAPSRLADQRCCYSDTAAFLDIYMPSEAVDAAACGGGTRPFGGTSAACPAAAGAIAQLLGAAPRLRGDRAGIVGLLQASGVPVIGDGHGKRRVDLLAALRMATPVGGAACFETAIGASLGLGDDQLSSGLPLGFVFPFANAVTSSIVVSSNGFVYPFAAQTAGDRCCTASGAVLTAQAPTIAPLWTDIDPGPSGAVHFHALPGRAVITWNRVRSYQGSQVFSVQCQLWESGAITFHYDAGVATTRNSVVGVSPGAGAVDPGGSDLSAAMPIASSGQPTIYEMFGAGGFDLADSMLRFLPDGAGGFALDEACRTAAFARYGPGCPARVVRSFYELFVPTAADLDGFAFELVPTLGGDYQLGACAGPCFDDDFSQTLAIGDDDVVRGLPLGFGFPFGGTSTPAIDVASNGYVFLQSGTIADSLCCNGSLTTLLAATPHVALFGHDLDPSSGGAVYFDTRADPQRATITWYDVPEFGNPSGRHTMQLQLFESGRMVFAYTTVANASHTALVGFHPSGPTTVPTLTDLSSLPRTLDLYAETRSLPRLGETLRLRLGNVPSGAGFAVLHVGGPPLQAPLTSIGMDACHLLTPVGFSIPLPIVAGLGTLDLAITSDPQLVGITVYTQALVLAPAANPLGVLASNGASLRFGL